MERYNKFYSKYLNIRKKVVDNLNYHVFCCALDLERRNMNRQYMFCSECEEKETCRERDGVFFR